MRLFITCWRHQATDDFGRTLPCPMTPPLSEAYVEITHGSISSEPFPQYTSFITIKADADCAIAFAAIGQDDPVADPDYGFVGAGERLYFGAAEGHRIAVIEVVR